MLPLLIHYSYRYTTPTIHNILSVSVIFNVLFGTNEDVHQLVRYFLVEVHFKA